MALGLQMAFVFLKNYGSTHKKTSYDAYSPRCSGVCMAAHAYRGQRTHFLRPQLQEPGNSVVLVSSIKNNFEYLKYVSETKMYTNLNKDVK